MSVSVYYVDFELPPATSTVNATGVASRAALGSPGVSSSGGGSLGVLVYYADLEIPLAAGAAQTIGVASRATVGSPELRSAVLATGLGSARAVGTPGVFLTPPVVATSVASVRAVGTPTVVGEAIFNGGGNVVQEVVANVSAAGVTSRRQIGLAVVTSTMPGIGTVTVNANGVASRAAFGGPIVVSGAAVNLRDYGIISRAAVGQPGVASLGLVVTVFAEGVASRRDFSPATVTQVGGAASAIQGGGPDDDDEVGPHKAPKHMRAHARREEKKKPAPVSVPEAVETKTIEAAPKSAPIPVEGGVLLTPEAFAKLKADIEAAAALKYEVRTRKESKLVAAAREMGAQKAQARVERLAEMAIAAALEAEYEPATREQVKQIEIEDPVTGKPIRATIRSTVAAED